MRVADDVVLPRRLWAELISWRASYVCEDCGRGRDQLKADGYSGRLNAHHIDEDKENNRLNNGRCLCPSCHQKLHSHGPFLCAPGCTCGRHTPHGNYQGGRPCKDGCSCERHKPPPNPFIGGSEPCPPGCTCKRHEAKYYGERNELKPCPDCGKVVRQFWRGTCNSCYHRRRKQVAA